MKTLKRFFESVKMVSFAIFALPIMIYGVLEEEREYQRKLS